VSLPLGLIGKQMGDMATEVDLKAREATALLAATFGEGLFTPEAQATLEQNYQDIVDRSLQLSIEFGETASDVVESVFFAIGTGFPTLEDAFKVVEQATMAAAAGATETSVAMNVLLDVMNAYGLGVDQVQTVSDILFQTVNVGKVEFSELAESLGDIIGIAPQLGISLEEVGAILATATKQGQSAGLTLTALRQVLLDVMAPREAGAEILAEVFETTADRAGLAVQQMIEMEGLFPTLQKVAQTAIDPVTGRFDPARAKLIFRRVQGLVRILPLFVNLTDQEAEAITNMNQALDAGADPIEATETAMLQLGDALAKVDGTLGPLTASYVDMQKATQGAGATANAFSEVAKSLDRRGKQATAAFDALKIVIGLELKAALLPVIETAGRLVRTLITMPEAAKKAIAFAIIIATALPLAIFAISTFISIIGNLIAVVGTLVAVALNPFVLAIGFIVFNLVKAKLATEEFTDGMTRAQTPIQKIIEIFIALASVAADVFTMLAQHVVNFVRFVARAVTTVANLFGADVEMPDLSAQRAEREAEAEAAAAAQRRGAGLGRGRGAGGRRAAGRQDGEEYAEGLGDALEQAEPELDRRFADLYPTEAETETTFTTISRAAIRALLRGMSDADFELFGDAVGLVEAEVNALGLTGENAAAALQNAQIALAEAVMGDASAWETLRSIIGDSVSLIQEYVQARQGAIAAEQALKAIERSRREEIARLDAKIAAIRERIRQFELDTAEIPERFTRHRRRQLEEELNAAQKEKDERQKQLDAQVEAAKAQAEAAKAHAQHLAELIRMEQRLLVDVEDTTEASEDLEAQMAALADTMQTGVGAPEGVAQIEGAFEGLGEKLNTLDLFFKGLMGQELDPVALSQLTDAERLAFEQGQRLREALDEIVTAFMSVIDAAKELGSVFAQVWDAMPDWLQDSLLIGGLVMGVGFKLIGGTLASLIGGALSGVGGLALSAGKWVLGLGVKLISGAASALTSGLSSALSGAGLGGLGTAAGVILPITAVVIAAKMTADAVKDFEQVYDTGKEQVEGGWDAFLQSLAIENQTAQQAADAIIAKRQEIESIYEGLDPVKRALVGKHTLLGEVDAMNALLAQSADDYLEYFNALQNVNAQIEDIPEVTLIAAMTPEEFAAAQAEAATATQDIGLGMVEGLAAVTGSAEGAATEVGAALTEPIVTQVEEMSDELVGQSIIPDMVDSAITEFERMGIDSSAQLTWFSGWVAQWGTSLLGYWYGLWDNFSLYSTTTVNQMVLVIQAAMEQITAIMQGMAAQSTQAASGMADDIVMASIIPDMVDQMLAEFNRMDQAASSSFGGTFGGMATQALAGAQGVTNAMSALRALPAGGAVGPVAAGAQGQTGVSFTIVNHWDAAITDKDRAELTEVSRSTTYEAIVLAYGGRPREQ
jgi:hypothetical protein